MNGIAWEKVKDELQEKGRNLLSNMLDAHLCQIMDTLGEIVDDNAEAAPSDVEYGMLPVTFTIAFGFKDNTFELDGRVVFARKITVKDTFDTIKIDPNQPELPLGEDDGPTEDDMAGKDTAGGTAEGPGSIEDADSNTGEGITAGSASGEMQ